MGVRFFQIAIIIFWVGSMAWLGKTIFTSDEAGMVRVDSRRPIHAFFDWNDNTQMAILRSGQKIGEARVTGLSGVEDKKPSFSVAVSLNHNVPPASVGTFAKILLQFEENLSFANGDLTFRIPSNNLNVRARIEGEEQILKADVNLAGNRIFTYDGSKQETLDPKLVGIVKNNSLVDEMLASTGDPTNWEWKMETFRGRHEMGGRRIPIYLMKLSIDQLEQELRIYFSEAGEPLKIDTDFEIQAISEVLVPVYRK